MNIYCNINIGMLIISTRAKKLFFTGDNYTIQRKYAKIIYEVQFFDKKRRDFQS